MLVGGEVDLWKATAVNVAQPTVVVTTISQPRMECYEQLLYSFGRNDLLLVNIRLPEERVLLGECLL